MSLPGVAGLCACACALVFVSAAGCTEKETAPPLKELPPQPLPEVPTPQGELPALPGAGHDERDLAYEVAPISVHGDQAPKNAARFELSEGVIRWDGAVLDVEAADAAARLASLSAEDRPVLVVPDEDTYLVQAAPLFARLDEAGVRTFLAHPDGKVVFRVTLSDEADFRHWVDQPTAGQIRVIHRADGFELQTNLGKLRGDDPNGPSVPLRGGQWDLARLRAGLGVLKDRFPSASESCIVPSFGMELSDVARALTAFYDDDGDRRFPVVCLVYPRPRGTADAGR